jgi:quercetin dioxygenase-like cupin family protein
MIIRNLDEISADDIAMPGMVVEGQGFFASDDGKRQALRTGDVVLTEPNEFHQMINASEDDVLRFFDVVGPCRVNPVAGPTLAPLSNLAF